jgi:CubicO group peptidase (beta-lactamase class C family)
MARLVFSGLFDRHPGLKIITHHMGAMIPFCAGRVGGGLDQLGSRTDDAEDMAALGALLLGHGRVHGRQVISAAWIDLAARPYAVTGRSWLPYVGYGQWLTRVGGHAASVITGAEGQLLEVVPGLGLVVVVTSGDPPPHTVASAPSEAFVEVVSGLIAPALT